jgi:hypothetical protein
VVVAIHENDLHRFVLSAFAALSVAKPAPDDEDADDGARPVARRCVIGTVASAVQRECDSRGVLRRACRGSRYGSRTTLTQPSRLCLKVS